MFNLFKKSEPKICLDCFYCEETKTQYQSYAKCINPKACNIDPVTGHKIIYSCSTQRSYNGNCGPKGKYFELKQV